MNTDHQPGSGESAPASQSVTEQAMAALRHHLSTKPQPHLNPVGGFQQIEDRAWRATFAELPGLFLTDRFVGDGANAVSQRLWSVEGIDRTWGMLDEVLASLDSAASVPAALPAAPKLTLRTPDTEAKAERALPEVEPPTPASALAGPPAGAPAGPAEIVGRDASDRQQKDLFH